MISNKVYNTSPLLTTQLYVKNGPDYSNLPLSKSRKAKIDHVRRLLKSGVGRGEVWNRAIHQYKMAGNDIITAING